MLQKKIMILIVMFALLFNCSAYATLTQNENAEFFDLFNLELPQLANVKAAVSQNNYTSALSLLLDYYKYRQTPIWYTMPGAPRVNTSYNRSKVDEILLHNFVFYSVEGNPNIAGTTDINWLYTPNNDPEWYWALNRQSPLKELSTAFKETSESKYALEFEKQFLDWYNDNPCPTVVDTKNTWRTLEAGIRIFDSMITYFNNFLYNTNIQNETKLLILKSLFQHGEYLTQFHGSGNWLLFECRGLYSLSMIFPEFKQAANWKSTALQRLEGEYNTQFLQDGWQYELTSNYHLESTKSVYYVQELAAMNGQNISFISDLSKSFEIAQKILLPGSRINPLNDTSWVNANDFLYLGAKFTQTTYPDKTAGFIATASEYSNGDTSLLQKSSSDDYAGVAHFRDFYGKGGIYGFFEAGVSGVGPHGWNSRDKLQFTLSAFDRELLIDPGVYSYAGQDVAKYMYTTPAHNTITIDGYDQVRRSQDVSVIAKDFKFLKSDSLDYAEGIYDEKYDESIKLSATHKRKVTYIKSGYFLINDSVTSTGIHLARQFWNFAPGKYTLNETTGIVNTNFDDGSNVMLIPIAYEGLEKNFGATAPYKGWTTAGANVAIPTLNLCYKKSFLNSGTLETVVIPYKGSTPPNVSAKRVDGHIEVTFDEYKDNIILQTDSTFVLNGSAAVVRESVNKPIMVSKLPISGSIKSNNVEISGANLDYKKDPTYLAWLSNNGTIQAEWAEFKKAGTVKCIYDSTAMGSSAIAMQPSSTIGAKVNNGLSKISAIAKGQNGIIEVYQNEVKKGQFQVLDNTYKEYQVSGLSGGDIKLKCITANVTIDYLKLTGTDITKISKYVVRQRLPVDYTQTIFGSQDTTSSTMKVDLRLNSSLISNSKTAIGALLRGKYKLRYNCELSQLEILRDDVLLTKKSQVLEPGEWYTFDFNMIGSTLRGSIYKKNTYFSGDYQLTANDSTYLSGEAGIFCEYADCSVDNLAFNTISEDFENYLVGIRPNNWLESEKGLWRVSSDSTKDIDSILKVTSYVGNEILEDENIKVGATINSAVTNAVLYCNGKPITLDNMGFANYKSKLGLMTFWLEGNLNGESISSEKLIINVVDKFKNANLAFDEPFTSYTGGLPQGYSGTGTKLTAYTKDGNTSMQLSNSLDTCEVYYRFPTKLTGYVITELDVTPQTLTATIPTLLIRDDTLPSAKESYVISFEKSGLIKNKITGITIGNYAVNNKYTVRIEYDFNAGTYNVSINGSVVIKNEAIPNSLTNLKTLYFAKIFSTGSALIDSAKVYQFPNLQKKKISFSNKNIEILNDTLKYLDGDTFVGLYKGNVLKSVYNTTEVTLDDEVPFTVKVFNFKDVIPQKSVAEYYFK